MANRTGLWVGDNIRIGEPVKKGMVLGHIYNLYVDEIETAMAPSDGLVFGLRCNPMVKTGNWKCFFAAVDEA